MTKVDGKHERRARLRDAESNGSTAGNKKAPTRDAVTGQLPERPLNTLDASVRPGGKQKCRNAH